MSEKNAARERDLKAILAALVVCFIGASMAAVHRIREIRAQNAALAGGTDPDHWPCEEDAKTLCPDVPRGDGKVNACLDQHARELSPACTKSREETGGDDDDWVFACSSELHSVCAGRHHQLECLKENQATLSPRCVFCIRTYEAADQWRRACFDDAARLCPGHSEEQSKTCLAGHLQDLGTSCRIYYSSPPQSGS